MRVRGGKDEGPGKSVKMKRRRRICWESCLLVTGIALVTFGVLVFLFVDRIQECIINSSLALNPNSVAFQKWRTNDPPLVMDMYIFNWTNADEVYNLDVKPRFEEIGPFRFKEVKEKIGIIWNENNTVTYRHRKSYYFDEEDSPMGLDVELTTINAVALTAAYQARNWNFFMKRGLSLSLTALSPQITVTKTARELLFDGYEDKFLNAAGLVKEVADKFGFFYNKNMTDGPDGAFNVYVANDEDFGKVKFWNYGNETGFYDGQCGKVVGSTGEFYPLNRKRDSIKVFSAELCRFAELFYVEDIVLKGVKGYKYSAFNLFDNGTADPANECFCGGECVPSGVLNVSSCRQNSPSFFSLPHFYAADPYYTSAVEGMHPDKEKHEFYMSIEPKSGLLIDITVRMQLNMLLQPLPGFALYEYAPRIFVPILYFTQRIPLTDELAGSLRLLANLPQVMTISSVVATSIGFFLLSLLLLCHLCKCRTSHYQQEYKITRDAQEEMPLRQKNGESSLIK